MASRAVGNIKITGSVDGIAIFSCVCVIIAGDIFLFVIGRIVTVYDGGDFVIASQGRPAHGFGLIVKLVSDVNIRRGSLKGGWCIDIALVIITATVGIVIGEVVSRV